jgi:hypothetical protein
MRRAILLTSALALFLTACSGSEPEATPEPDTTTSVVPGPATTEPGTDLDLGDAATLAWQPSENRTGVLDLTVEEVAEQSQSVFDGWVRDDAMSDARPYFVRVTLRNAGDADLGGQAVPLYLRDDTGALGAPWTLGGDFTACQSGPLPTTFAPGDEADMCLVYLVPDGARIKDMVFEPTEGYDPITWTGDVAKPARATTGKVGKKAGKKTDEKTSGRG